MKFADYIVAIISGGVMLLLLIIILGDYMIAMRTDRVLDPEIITLMKMSITGLIGIIGGYVGGRQASKESEDNNVDNE